VEPPARRPDNGLIPTARSAVLGANAPGSEQNHGTAQKLMLDSLLCLHPQDLIWTLVELSLPLQLGHRHSLFGRIDHYSEQRKE
jgi:hypothetical protein